MIVKRIAGSSDCIEPVRAGGASDRLTADGYRECCRRGPGVRHQIGMQIIDTGVDDADDRGAGADGGVPRRRGRNIDAGSSGRAVDHLADVAQSPQLGETRVVWFAGCMKDVVRFSVQNVATRGEQVEEGADFLAAGTHAPDATITDDRVGVGVEISTQACEVRLRPKCHQHFAGNRRMGAEQLRRTIASERKFELTGRQAGRRNEQRDHQCAGVARSERTAANLHAARL